MRPCSDSHSARMLHGCYMVGRSEKRDGKSEKGCSTSSTVLAHHRLLLRPSGKSYTIYTCYTSARMIGFSCAPMLHGSDIGRLGMDGSPKKAAPELVSLLDGVISEEEYLLHLPSCRDDALFRPAGIRHRHAPLCRRM